MPDEIIEEQIDIENADYKVEPGKTGDDELIMQDPFNPNEINITSKPDTLRNLIESQD